MSQNKYGPQVVVFPEDGANRQIVNGFLLNPSLNPRAVHVLPLAKGWRKVRDAFKGHNKKMLEMPARIMVLLVDFDDDNERVEHVLEKVDLTIRDRVFVLGTFTEPEKLTKELGTYETIGRALAEDCVKNERKTWGHALLKHNAAELDRMMPKVREILFGTS